MQVHPEDPTDTPGSQGIVGEKIQAQYKSRHDKHMVDHQFQVGDRYGFT
jgi:hypothetical protein